MPTIYVLGGRNTKNNVYSVNPSFTIAKSGLRGSKSYRYVFVMICGVCFVIIVSFFCASRRLLFVIAAFTGHLHLYFPSC